MRLMIGFGAGGASGAADLELGDDLPTRRPWWPKPRFLENFEINFSADIFLRQGETLLFSFLSKPTQLVWRSATELQIKHFKSIYSKRLVHKEYCRM
jgi:hypothetical protein